MPRQARGRGRKDYTDKISEDRIASLHFLFGQIGVYLKYSDESIDSTPQVFVAGTGTQQRFQWSLCNLTGEELESMRQLFELAFQLAKPVVEIRDAEAEQAFELGDDSRPRIFRQKPVFVVRPARRKVAHALRAEVHNQLVDMMESYKEHIRLNVNELRPPVEDFDFAEDYHGEDAADADINLPLEK